jgi:hypothetical protein
MEMEDHAMRISERRYEKEQQQHAIALRFLAYEARTQTIRTWTGLSDARIRNLYNTYFVAAGSPAVRHRGKSPYQAGFFYRTAKVRQEAVWLASLFILVGLIKIDAGSLVERREWMPDLHRAELLCQAFDTYVAMVPSAHISFEHAIFLAKMLNRGEHLRLGACPDCGSVLIKDPLSIREARCSQCSRRNG